jgi:hypothetical protein
VERAFFEAGKALAKLRDGLRRAVGDRRLYRSTHCTFEEYCWERFGHSRRQSYLLITPTYLTLDLDTLINKSE